MGTSLLIVDNAKKRYNISSPWSIDQGLNRSYEGSISAGPDGRQTYLIALYTAIRRGVSNERNQGLHGSGRNL